MNTVLTLGTFDMLHVGHLELFHYCRSYAEGGTVVVAVNPDWFVEEFKGARPVIPLRERMEMVAACRDVDAVVCNAGGEDAMQTISVVRPDIIVVGDDWRDKDYAAQLGVTPEWAALKVRYVPRTRNRASSALKDQIRTNGINVSSPQGSSPGSGSSVEVWGR